ncbi:MAG: hypothetical protein QOF82_846 [Frankiales bacterium]|jgi:hypothetical protein|nr:hypothetical protein [Frankiales bacterium]MDX6208106.1 hypothetical protein [Frankiales bacterium]MDX6211759.1 hypothetical protein [Frankiales bacterium]
MSVTPFLMLEALADDRRRDLKATAGARRRNRRTPELDLHANTDVVRAGLLARFRHTRAA